MTETAANTTQSNSNQTSVADGRRSEGGRTAISDQFRIFNEARIGTLYMGLSELRATVMEVLHSTKKSAEKRILEALAAGMFVRKWTNPPTTPWPRDQDPPGRDPRWLTIKRKWRKGLVLDEFDRARTGVFEWRGLLISRLSVARWLQVLLASQSSEPEHPRVAPEAGRGAPVTCVPTNSQPTIAPPDTETTDSRQPEKVKTKSRVEERHQRLDVAINKAIDEAGEPTVDVRWNTFDAYVWRELGGNRRGYGYRTIRDRYPLVQQARQKDKVKNKSEK